MSDPQPVTVGEVLRGIRAADHNAFYETWKKVNQLPPKQSPKPQKRMPGQLVVTVHTDETVPIDSDFPVLKITGVTISPDERESALHDKIAFEGITPDFGTALDEIAIVQGPLGNNGVGRGVISGYTYAMVEWTDETHTHCRPKVGDNEKLKSSATGLRIVAHEEIPDPEYLPATLWH